MKIYLIRHADPDYANDTITPHGHREAAALATRMQKEGITRIVASPLGRAQATARYTADLLKLPVTTEPWTREIDFGAPVEDPVLGKIAPWDLDPPSVLRHDTSTTDACLTTPLLKPVPVQATLDVIRRETDLFFEELGYRREGRVYRVVRHNAERVALFCHGGFGLTWLSILLNLPLTLTWAGFWLPPTSVTTLLFEMRTTGLATLRCMGVADVSHLYHAGLDTQPRGLVANRE